MRLALRNPHPTTDFLQQIRELPNGQNLPNLRDLTLQGFDLQTAFGYFAKIIEFSKIITLTLSDCRNEEHFIEKLKESLSRNPSSLQHFAVGTVDSDRLCDTLEATSNLTNLHVEASYQFGLPGDQGLVRLLNIKGRTLETLSLNGPDLDFLEYPIEPDFFAAVCANCPNLTQLAFRASDDALNYDAPLSDYWFGSFLVRIARIRIPINKHRLTTCIGVAPTSPRLTHRSHTPPVP